MRPRKTRWRIRSAIFSLIFVISLLLLGMSHTFLNLTFEYSNHEHEHAFEASDTKKVLFGYGQNCCRVALQRLCEYGLKRAHFDACLTFNQSLLDEKWLYNHSDIMMELKGAGYWLWKPYLIHHLLNDDTLLADGDYLVYMDAGAYPIAPLQDLFDFMRVHWQQYNGVLFFGSGLLQKEWCKRDTFILQDCDEEQCWNAEQIDGFFSIWRKSEFSLNLSAMWLKEASNKHAIDDSSSVLGSEFTEFAGHRHDQAIITNIMNRENYPYESNRWDLSRYIVHDRFQY